jgi:hypothetical protein
MEMKIQHLFTMIDDLFSTMNAVITVKNYPIDVPTLRAKRDAIELNNEKLNLQNLKDIKKGLYKYKVGIIYTDLFSEMAVMSDHIYHSLKYMKDIKV